MSMFTQQPRWLLLSIFLLLWSCSSALRRDGARPKSLGIGVEARTPPFEGTWRRRQVFSSCVESCATNAGQNIGCGSPLFGLNERLSIGPLLRLLYGRLSAHLKFVL
ncbi:hypothetical protein C8Q76DRAFT_195241 [Earliella scabrosa]|nr:hypothetical protein C8Q76DRAFT_195241 [Earliella scabrosa]